jgi:hypothetical protein
MTPIEPIEPLGRRPEPVPAVPPSPRARSPRERDPRERDPRERRDERRPDDDEPDPRAGPGIDVLA